ncbi:duboraya isoform X1 [Colossoma macropomum]|uniref:duboraya isoform X1 n=1 Tax=Colossoma macropomum TaxID=42526 RepID=UPI0018644928|nr:duboraya isoform X1 [Colossoma macropomum]
MEKESTGKRSVAELAGKFACQIPVPTGPDGNKPVRRRPPRTLELPASNNAGQGQDEQQKGEATSHPPRKQRNSALIEKLQANLVLSPTALLPSPMSPGAAKPPPVSFSSNSPCSPVSPAAAPKASQEAPASFEKPAEGTVLLSINKGRARHSIKRRPPSRRHRKSSSDDVGAEEEKTASPVSESAAPGGKEEDVFKKQNVEEKEDSSAEPVSSTSEQQKEQIQSASPDSEQQPTAEGEKESKACEEAPVSSEKEEKVEEEKVEEERR